jgi:hypothetical protein
VGRSSVPVYTVHPRICIHDAFAAVAFDEDIAEAPAGEFVDESANSMYNLRLIASGTDLDLPQKSCR